VSAIAWPHALAIYSGGWDHTIRLWDPHAGVNTSTWNSDTLISALDFSLASNLLATAHPDGGVRVWDPRLQQVKTCVQGAAPVGH
jgi:ribosome biogenesis protein YTM1